MKSINSRQKKLIILILLIVVLAVISYFIFFMPKKGHEASVEIEKGQTSGNGPVIVGEDPEASGGKYIQFEPKE